MYIYERSPRKDILSEATQEITMTLLSRSFEKVLTQHRPENLVGVLIDKSWAHHIPTPTSDIDALFVSRGEVTPEALWTFTDRLSEAMRLMRLNNNRHDGLRMIDPSTDVLDILTQEGQVRLRQYYDYNQVPLILITNEVDLNRELSTLGMDTIKY